MSSSSSFVFGLALAFAELPGDPESFKAMLENQEPRLCCGGGVTVAVEGLSLGLNLVPTGLRLSGTGLGTVVALVSADTASAVSKEGVLPLASFLVEAFAGFPEGGIVSLDGGKDSGFAKRFARAPVLDAHQAVSADHHDCEPDL